MQNDKNLFDFGEAACFARVYMWDKFKGKSKGGKLVEKKFKRHFSFVRSKLKI